MQKEVERHTARLDAEEAAAEKLELEEAEEDPDVEIPKEELLCLWHKS